MSFAPLTMFVWSIGAKPRWQQKSLKWVRFAILAQLHLALFTIAVMCLVALMKAVQKNTFLETEIIFWIIIASLLISFLNSIVLLFSPASDHQGRLILTYRRILLATGSVGILTVLTWSVANVVLVVRSAEQLAVDKPYCLQVQAHRLGCYQPVMSMLDLLGLKMRAEYKDHLAFSYHALLVIGAGEARKTLNWSYRQQTFIPTPKGDHLPLWGSLSARPASLRPQTATFLVT